MEETSERKTGFRELVQRRFSSPRIYKWARPLGIIRIYLSSILVARVGSGPDSEKASIPPCVVDRSRRLPIPFFAVQHFSSLFHAQIRKIFFFPLLGRGVTLTSRARRGRRGGSLLAAPPRFLKRRQCDAGHILSCPASGLGASPDPQFYVCFLVFLSLQNRPSWSELRGAPNVGVLPSRAACFPVKRKKEKDQKACRYQISHIKFPFLVVMICSRSLPQQRGGVGWCRWVS